MPALPPAASPGLDAMIPGAGVRQEKLSQGHAARKLPESQMSGIRSIGCFARFPEEAVTRIDQVERHREGSVKKIDMVQRIRQTAFYLGD